jgi:NAD(P)-dependent dehydrogenase (short-subunit alcohol dehydrogenase family)
VSTETKFQGDIMDLQLANKKALVTGGSRGIGKATARALALEGCDVAICARSEGPLQEAAAEISKETGRNIFPMVCDTMDPESIKRFVARSAEELGGLQIAVNSAARVGGTPGTIETVSDADVLRDFEEKVVGYMRVSQAAVPYMKEAGWGRIINVSGGAGRSPGMAVSGGIRNIGTSNLTKSMSNGLGQYGINVNCVYPGLTLTEATLASHMATAEREGISLEEQLARLAERTANRHVPTAEDIAKVIVFLCSPAAVAITGETIAAMGGTSQDVHV